MVFSGLDELAQRQPSGGCGSLWRSGTSFQATFRSARFENRRIAVARLWQAIQKLEDLQRRNRHIDAYQTD